SRTAPCGRRPSRPMSNCTQCGHAVADDARFCSNCGSPVNRSRWDHSQSRGRDRVGDTTSTISLSGIQALEAEADGVDPVGPDAAAVEALPPRSEEHTSELQSRENLVCRLLLEKKKKL